MTRSLIFVTKTHQYNIKFHCRNEEVLGGLLLLAVFPSLLVEFSIWSLLRMLFQMLYLALAVPRLFRDHVFLCVRYS